MISYLLFFLFIYPLSYLPFGVLYVFSDFLFYIIFYLIGYRKKVIIHNLVKSFPEKSEEEIRLITKKFYIYFCDLLVENIKLLNITEKEITTRCKFTNPELLNHLYYNNKSVIAVVGHYCNWEMCGLALALNAPHQVMAIYKTFSNQHFDRLMKKMRSRFNTLLIPMENTLRVMLEKKEELTLTVFISDQTPSDVRNSYWTRFLHQETPIFLGTEKIARKTNYPVIFFYPKKVNRGFYEIEIISISDEPQQTKENEITEKHTRILEKIINANPEFWLWSHRRWKRKRKPEINNLQNAN